MANFLDNTGLTTLITLIKGDLATKQPTITASGLLKGDGTTISAAVAGTDYVEPQSFASHVSDTTVHVTAEERAAWNGKQDTSTAITTANIANQNVNKAKYATDDVAVGAPGLRNEKFVSTETTPTVNGQICWTYG